jgi:hypothetical protein
MSDESYGFVNSQSSSEHTSNDLLFRLHPEGSRKVLNYRSFVQSADEVQDVRNASPFLIGFTVPGQRAASRRAIRG